MNYEAMMWTMYSLLFPKPKMGIWNFVLAGSLNLICLVFCLLCGSKSGTYGIGGQVTDFHFLYSKFLRPSGRDLRLELMAYCQSGVSRMRHLKDNLGGTCRILRRGSA